jgi:ubiquinone/menaquinone biosynthesis C-methylase UbiE
MPDWWRTYFGDDFFDLHVDLFPEQESRAEVAALLDLMGLPAGSRILDVPCGWGRHTHLLAEAGFVAVGADLSEPLLRRASATSPGPRAFAACDIRALPFADACMDGAINVFTSLGLFASDDDDRRALCEIHRVLRKGGSFLLETMHRDEVICGFAERDRWTLTDGTEVRVRRRFDPITALSHERLQWRRGSEAGEKRHTLRLRTATEVAALLQAAGFRDIDYYGDWDGSPFTHRSPHLIALARGP